jgi:hypothetical protein
MDGLDRPWCVVRVIIVGLCFDFLLVMTSSFNKNFAHAYTTIIVVAPIFIIYHHLLPLLVVQPNHVAHDCKALAFDHRCGHFFTFFMRAKNNYDDRNEAHEVA